MKPTIQYDDFAKLDIRVGLVTAATAPEWSNKLIQLTVDFGPEIGTKTILTGMRKWFEPDVFLNKKFPFLINLAERKMGEGVSQGMMMAADAPYGGAAEKDGEMAPALIEIDDDIVPGTAIH